MVRPHAENCRPASNYAKAQIERESDAPDMLNVTSVLTGVIGTGLAAADIDVDAVGDAMHVTQFARVRTNKNFPHILFFCRAESHCETRNA